MTLTIISLANSIAYGRLQRRLGKRRLNHALHVSRQHGYAYMSNPKAACSTLKLYLARAELGDPEFNPPSVHKRRHMPHLRPSQLSSKEQKDLFRNQFFVFSFVRHPLQRLISAYADKILGNRPQKAEILRSLDKDAAQLETFVSLDEFIDVITNQPPEELNPHWRPQVLNLAPDVLSYDFIGRVENFQEDFALLKSTLKLPDLPVVIRNRKAAKNRADIWLNRDQHLALCDLYAEDFKVFAYSRQGMEDAGRLSPNAVAHRVENSPS